MSAVMSCKRIVSLVAGILGAGLLLACGGEQKSIDLPREMTEPWISRAEHALSEGSANPGLESLVRAHALAAAEEGKLDTRIIENFIRAGLRRDQRGLAEYLEPRRDAIEAALDAAREAPFPMPPPEATDGMNATQRHHQDLVQLLLLEARRLESAGEIGAAAETAVLAMRLADLLCSEDSLLAAHMVGILNMRLGAIVLVDLLTRPELTEDEIHSASDSLAQIEENHTPIIEGLRASRLPFLQKAIEAGWNDERLSMLHESTVQMVRETRDDLEMLDAAQQLLWEKVLDIAQRPHAERTPMDSAWLQENSDQPILLLAFPNLNESLTWHDLMLAQIRLARALCALRLGESTDALNDPFSSSPLEVTDARVFSVGPDGLSQSGESIFDPDAGLSTAGDIVAPR